MSRSTALRVILAVGFLTLVISFPFDPVNLRLDNRTVRYNRERLNWFKAAESCRRRGLQLLSVRSEQEDLEVSNHGMFLGMTSVWLAASDLAECEKWMWATTGDPVEKAFWARNEPRGQDENCVELHLETGKWAAVDCRQKIEYACEDAPRRSDRDKGFWRSLIDFFMG